MAAKTGKSVARYCEARTRAGGLCKRPAGWGTGHFGRGRCVKHAGKTPSHERKNAREAAHEFVIGQLGYEVQIDPLDGALMAVHMARGAVEYWKAELGKAHEAGEAPSMRVAEGYRLAMHDLGRMSDAASKAGVAERLIAITERQVEQITLAFEEALAGEKLEREQRMRMVARFSAGLAKAEGEQLALEPGEG